MTNKFSFKEPSVLDYWRGIILRGRNVASYKFALAQTLLELRPAAGELIKIGELAPTFAKYITEHIKLSDKQGTSRSSKFLDACRDFNSEKITQNQLIELTIKYGFNNVIDAFHIIDDREVKRFYTDERKDNNGIRITDELSLLFDSEQLPNLSLEVDARWRLVETAWELSVPRSVVAINYDVSTEELFAVDRSRKRKPVTGSRGALNGYQKGSCFYCFSVIQISGSDNLAPEVDHFFPHTLKSHKFNYIDGIWNLVLSCQNCNRGSGGKFAQLPTERLLRRLHRRNESLIASHHPLRETLMQQTGETVKSRESFLRSFYQDALKVILHRWQPEEKCDEFFI